VLKLVNIINLKSFRTFRDLSPEVRFQDDFNFNSRSDETNNNNNNNNNVQFRLGRSDVIKANNNNSNSNKPSQQTKPKM
jgi:hypothetical protein